MRALILGIVQGLTEFIPVSSSGHLVIVPWLFGWEGSGLEFNVALQLGTLVAVFVYYRRDLWQIASGSVRALAYRRPEDEQWLRLAGLLVLGTMPAVVAGLLIEDAVDDAFHSGAISRFSLTVVAAGLVLMGLALLWAERWGTRQRDASSLGPGQVLLIGVAQSLALMPGVSRSGSTITAGLLLGMKRAEAARFSFLLAVPVTLGAGALEGARLLDTGLPRDQWLSFAVGVSSAAVVGYASIWFLLTFLQTHSTRPFAYYRVALAVVVGILLAAGWNAT